MASGATYRFGLGPIVTTALRCGAGRWPGIARLFSMPAVRNWLYYTLRRGTADRFARLARPGQAIIVIGDAASPGKSKQAIASAFEAALLPANRPRPSVPATQP